MNNKKKGILLMLLSALFFALMATTVKLAETVPNTEKIFVRNLISMFISAFMLLKHRKNFKGNNKKLLWFRSIFGLLGLLTYFHSIEYLPLGDAVSLNKLSPFFVMILAAIFLKEKIYGLQIPAILLALTGAIFISKPQFSSSFLPAMMGILGALFAASSYTIIRQLRKTDDPEVIVFYFSSFSTIGMLPFYKEFIFPSYLQLAALVGVGVFASIAQFSMTYAYRYMNAGALSIYDYSQIIFSMIIAWILWRQTPDFISLMGACFILLGGMLNYYIVQKKLKE